MKNSWRLSTAIILVILIILFVLIGDLIGGIFGTFFNHPEWRMQCVEIMLVVALVVALYCYLSPVNPVLNGMNAMQINEHINPRVYGIVKGLAEKAGTPMPDVYVCNVDYPNAFALGRSPDKALVAVTYPLLDLLSDDELEGVLGHELSHITHRDTIVNGVARTSAKVLTTFAVVMGVVAMISVAVLGAAGSAAGRSKKEDGSGFLLLILIALLIPVIIVGLIMYIAVPGSAAVLRFGISRSREYGADESSARLTGKPLALASALIKIDNYCIQTDNTYKTKTTVAAPLMIINPFGVARTKFRNRLLSTHPTTESRVERLQKLDEELRNTLNTE